MPMRVHRHASKAYPVPVSPPPCTMSAGVARQHSTAEDMPWRRGEGSVPGWPSRPFLPLLPSLPSFPGAPSLPVAPASKKSETLRPAIRAKPSHKKTQPQDRAAEGSHLLCPERRPCPPGRRGQPCHQHQERRPCQQYRSRHERPVHHPGRFSQQGRQHLRIQPGEM